MRGPYCCPLGKSSPLTGELGRLVGMGSMVGEEVGDPVCVLCCGLTFLICAHRAPSSEGYFSHLVPCHGSSGVVLAIIRLSLGIRQQDTDNLAQN